MVDVTFGGDVDAAREHVRLFMIRGMGRCSGWVPELLTPLIPR